MYHHSPTERHPREHRYGQSRSLHEDTVLEHYPEDPRASVRVMARGTQGADTEGKPGSETVYCSLSVTRASVRPTGFNPRFDGHARAGSQRAWLTRSLYENR
jgi:hypothetical protein